MLFLFISFVAGVLTVLAPCILPLLPVIIGAAVSEGENRRKALTIIFSLIISIVVFTLLLKYSTAFIGIPPIAWQIFSGAVLIFLGLSMVFPGIWEHVRLAGLLNREGNELMGAGYRKKSFWGDVIIGAALGPVFSSCSPTYFVILATVLPAHFAIGLVYLLLYAIGLGCSLLLISRFGQRLTARLETISDPRHWFKRSIGILFLLVGVAVITGLDKKVQTAILQHGSLDVTKIEDRLLEQSH